MAVGARSFRGKVRRSEAGFGGVRSQSSDLIRSGEQRHVRVVQRKVEDVRVFADARGRSRLRERQRAALQAPADEHLRHRLAVLLRHRNESGSAESFPAAKRW